MRDRNLNDDPLDALLQELAGADEEELEAEEEPVVEEEPVEVPDSESVPWEPQEIVETAVQMATARSAMMERAAMELKSEFPELDDADIAAVAAQMRGMKTQDLVAFMDAGGHKGLAFAVLGMKVKKTGGVPKQQKREFVTPVGPYAPEEQATGILAEIEKIYGPLPPQQAARIKKELGL